MSFFQKIYNRYKILSTDESHSRCTNQSLVPFGINIKTPIHNTASICRHLHENGWICLELGSLLTKSSLPKSFVVLHGSPEKNGKMLKYDLEKLHKDYPEFNGIMTLTKFVSAFNKGRFILGTSGHSMSLIDGVLYDAEKKGANLRRVNFINKVFTKNEFDEWKTKYVLEET